MKKLGKKGDNSIGINKIMVLILCILVLAAILFFIFKSDILNYIINLPGYSYNQTDRIIDPGNPTSGVFSSSCPMYIGATSVMGRNFIVADVAHELMDITVKGSSVPLYWDRTNNNIYLNIDWGSDLQIGTVVNNQILLDSKWILDKTSRAGYPTLPSPEVLNLLDKSFFSTNNKICKNQLDILNLPKDAPKIDLSLPAGFNGHFEKVYEYSGGITSDMRAITECSVDFGAARGGSFRIVRSPAYYQEPPLGGEISVPDAGGKPQVEYDWQLQNQDASKTWVSIPSNKITPELTALKEDLTHTCTYREPIEALSLKAYYNRWQSDKNGALNDPDFPFSDMSGNGIIFSGNDIVVPTDTWEVFNAPNFKMVVKDSWKDKIIYLTMSCGNLDWVRARFLGYDEKFGATNGVEYGQVTIPLSSGDSIYLYNSIVRSFDLEIRSYNRPYVKATDKMKSACTFSTVKIEDGTKPAP